MDFPLANRQPAVVTILPIAEQPCAEAWCSAIDACRSADAGRDVSVDAADHGSADALVDAALDATLDATLDAMPSDASGSDTNAFDADAGGGGCPQVCSDGNLCNGVESCVNGQCVPGTPLVCPSNGLGCDGVETCVPSVGCTVIHVPNCSDGLACTTDACREPGVCQNTPINCPPSNDLPGNPTALPGDPVGRIAADLTNATQQGTGCGTNEVYFTWSLPVRSIVRLTTEASFDTEIAYRGADCTGQTRSCGSVGCTGPQASLLEVLPAGVHCFSVSVGSGSGSTFRLGYERMTAASGNNVMINGDTVSRGSLNQFGGNIAPTCSGAVNGTEDAYFFEACDPDQMVSATTCNGTGTLDTVLSLRSPTGELACNDDDQVCSGIGRSTIDSPLTNAGLYAVVVDAEAQTGSYTVTIQFYD